MSEKQRIAHDAGVKSAEDLYEPDNSFMRNVVAIIAMTAIESYQRELRNQNRKKL